MAALKAAVNCEVTTIPAGSYVEETITNDPVTLTVRKVDQAGNLLDGAQFTLKKDIADVTPNAAHTVTGEVLFENLTAGSYELQETAAPESFAIPGEQPWSFTLDANGNVTFAKEYQNLSISSDGMYLVVLNTPETTSVVANKAWQNADGSTTAPAGATVAFTLYADGVPTNYTVILDGTADTAPAAIGGYESEAWTATFVNQPKYQAGTTTEIIYTVAETTGYTGYTASTADPVANGETITNTQDESEISVAKAWQNADGSTTAPENATVVFTLYADGTGTKYTVTLDGTADTAPTTTGGYESEAWTATFVNLPKTDSTTGEDIVYTVAETAGCTGYEPDSADPVAGGGTITNKQNMGSLKISKTLASINPAHQGKAFSFTVMLIDNEGKGMNGSFTLNGTESLAVREGEATITLKDGEQAIISGLPAGTKYVVMETAEDDLTMTCTGGSGVIESARTAEASFTNTYSNEMKITATKQWKGDEEHIDARRDVTVNLYKKVGFNEKKLVGSQIIPADAQGNALTVKWDKVPVFELQDGKAVEIEYSVTETMAYGEGEKNPYVPMVMGTARDGFTIINRYATASIQIEAVKKLEGRKLEEGQFEFQLVDYAGNVVSTTTNTADGTVLFPAFEYVASDILDVPAEEDGARTKYINLKIMEVDDNQPGYTYDDWFQNFTITLHLDANGNLTAECNIAAGEVMFTNSYAAKGETTFSGKKTLEGRDLAAAMPSRSWSTSATLTRATWASTATR